MAKAVYARCCDYPASNCPDHARVVPIMTISPPCAGQPFRKDDIEDSDGGVSTSEHLLPFSLKETIYCAILLFHRRSMFRSLNLTSGEKGREGESVWPSGVPQ